MSKAENLSKDKCIKGNIHIMKQSRFDDLKKIYLLKTLVNQGSLNKAAQIHKITPSAISQTIKILETNLGYPVVVKQNDIWKATEKGEIILEQAEKVFAALNDTFADDLIDKLKLNSLSLGIYDNFTFEIVQKLCHKARLDYPEIKLHIQNAKTSELIKKIQSGELCSAVISQTDSLPTDLISKVLYTDHLGFFTSSMIEQINVKDMKRMTMGILSGGSEGLPMYLKKFIKQVPDFRPNVNCDSFEILKELAELSDAIVVLPKRLAQKSKIPLREINFENMIFNGEHNILLIASSTCDRREFDYITSLLC